MVQIGKVYLDTRDKNYYYCASITKVKGCINYIFNRVTSIGRLGFSKNVPRTQILKYKNRYKIQDGIKVKISFDLPKSHRSKMLWQQTISNGKSEIKGILKSKSEPIKERHRTTLAKIAHCSVGHYMELEDRESNLRDYAFAVGFKQPSKLYAIIAKYLESRHRPGRKIKAFNDSTILDTIHGYKNSWKLIHGFSKKIDSLIDADFKAHLAEARRRKLEH